MTRIVVRRHRPDDTAAAVEVDQLSRTPLLREVPAAFAGGELGLLSPEMRARRAADLGSLLAASESWVALVDGEIVGFVAVAPHQELATGEVLEFALDPRWRGQGVASALLARSRGLLPGRSFALAG